MLGKSEKILLSLNSKQKSLCQLATTKLYPRGLQTFSSEGHISYYTTFRGPDILRNVIVLGYATF